MKNFLVKLLTILALISLVCFRLRWGKTTYEID